MTQMSNQQISARALLHLFAVVLLLCHVFTSNLKYSCIVAALAVANYVIFLVYFALPRAREDDFRYFLQGIHRVAHRGGADDAPENTIAAIKDAHKRGSHAIEVDISVTKDGIPVLMHDDTLERTTDGVGRIDAIDFADLQQLNAAAKYRGKESFAREAVPTLQEAFDLCRQLHLRMFLDIKDGDERVVQALLKLFSCNADSYRFMAVCSFYPKLLFELKKADNRIIIGHTWRRHLYTYKDLESKIPRFTNPVQHLLAQVADYANVYLLHHWLYQFSGAQLILVMSHHVSIEYIRDWSARGIQCVAWTVNEQAAKAYYTASDECRLPYMTDHIESIGTLG